MQSPTQSIQVHHQDQTSPQATVSPSISISSSSLSIHQLLLLEDTNKTIQTSSFPPAPQVSTFSMNTIIANNVILPPTLQTTQILHPLNIPATSLNSPHPQTTNTAGIFTPNCLIPLDLTTNLPKKNGSTMRLIFQNVNGLPTTPKHPKLDSIQSFMTLNQVDVLGVSEVNVAWHTIPTLNQLHSLTCEWFETCHLSIAWNTHEKTKST